MIHVTVFILLAVDDKLRGGAGVRQDLVVWDEFVLTAQKQTLLKLQLRGEKTQA